MTEGTTDENAIVLSEDESGDDGAETAERMEEEKDQEGDENEVEEMDEAVEDGKAERETTTMEEEEVQKQLTSNDSKDSEDSLWNVADVSVTGCCVGAPATQAVMVSGLSKNTTAEDIGLSAASAMTRHYYDTHYDHQQAQQVVQVPGEEVDDTNVRQQTPPEWHCRRMLGRIVIFDPKGDEKFRTEVEVSGPKSTKSNSKICQDVANELEDHFNSGKVDDLAQGMQGLGLSSSRLRKAGSNSDNDSPHKKSRGENNHDEGHCNIAAKEYDGDEKKPPAVASGSTLPSTETSNQAPPVLPYVPPSAIPAAASRQGGGAGSPGGQRSASSASSNSDSDSDYNPENDQDNN